MIHRPSNWPKSDAHLKITTTMYREIEMRFWPEKADAEMKERFL